jgi:hypothetical protein
MESGSQLLRSHAYNVHFYLSSYALIKHRQSEVTFSSPLNSGDPEIMSDSSSKEQGKVIRLALYS